MQSNSVDKLDLAQIGPLFRRSRALGEGLSFLEERVAAELMERLELLEVPDGPWLDLGCGEGRLLQHLCSFQGAGEPVVGLDLVPTGEGLRISADAHRTPFSAAKFGLVASNLLLPWCDAKSIFQEVRRTLRPDGIFVFSTFGASTLEEMRRAWLQVDSLPHVHRLPDLHDLGDLLIGSGFSNPVVDAEILRIEYDVLDRLLLDLKQSGYVNLAEGRRRTLTGKTRFSAFRRSYGKLANHDGKLAATFEVVYGYARATATSIRVMPPT